MTWEHKGDVGTSKISEVTWEHFLDQRSLQSIGGAINFVLCLIDIKLMIWEGIQNL